MANQVTNADPRIRGNVLPEPVEAVLRIVHPHVPLTRTAILETALAALPLIPESYEPWPSVGSLSEEISGDGGEAEVTPANVDRGENVAGHVLPPADNKEGE